MLPALDAAMQCWPTMGTEESLDPDALARAVAIGSSGYRVLTPVPRAVWQSLAVNSPTAVTFQTPAWMDALCRAQSMRDASRLYLAPDGRMLVLPLARHRLAGIAASMPHGYGTGGLFGIEAERREDVAACLADLAGAGFTKISLRPSPMLAEVWRDQAGDFHTETRDTQTIDLDGGYDHFFTKVLDSSMRAKVRRAERLGVEIEWDSTQRGIDIFYDVYTGWLDERADRRHLSRRLIRFTGHRREPRAKYVAVSDALGAACRTWIAWFEGKPAAAAIELVHGGHAAYWRGASDRALVTRSRANELLHCRMIEFACESGCRWYDMGESGGVESLMQFKRRFGAQVLSTVEIQIESRAAALSRSSAAKARAALEPLRRRLG